MTVNIDASKFPQMNYNQYEEYNRLLMEKLQNLSRQNSSKDLQRKREIKGAKKQITKQQSLLKRQNTVDSILDASVKHESGFDSACSRKTRGLGKKTIEKQKTISLDT